MGSVDHAERLDGPLPPVLGIGLIGVESVDVDAGDVGVRTTVEDPTGDQASESAGGEDPDRIETGRDEVVAQLGSLADDRGQVGSEALGSAEELPDSDSWLTGTRPIAFSTYGPMRSQSGWISPNENESGMVSTFHGARFGFEQPDHQPAHFFAVVAVRGGVLDTGHDGSMPGTSSVIR